VFQDKGKLQEAKAAYQKVLATNPLFTPAARDLALLCFQHFPDEAGLYDLAVQARQAFPDDPTLAKCLGILSYRREDLPRARQLLTQATQVLKEDGEALCYLGLTLHRLNQNTESQPLLTRALSLKPEPKLTQLANQALDEIRKTATKL
jgi:tetratricopeptide (TPR) repeat protein